MTGKEICKELRKMRKDVALYNGILYFESDCNHEGDCAGTCPKCDEAVSRLTRMLELRAAMGYEVKVEPYVSLPFLNEELVLSLTNVKRHQLFGNELHHISGSYDEGEMVEEWNQRRAMERYTEEQLWLELGKYINL